MYNKTKLGVCMSLRIYANGGLNMAQTPSAQRLSHLIGLN